MEALNPPADMGAMVGGGASGATSQLTLNRLKSKEAKIEKGLQDKFLSNHYVDIHDRVIYSNKAG